MRLYHNMASINVYQGYSKNLVNQSNALQKISSGYKVNSAKDNPNAIAQSEKIRMQIRGIQMAQRNVQDGVSMLQTAEGGLEGITSMYQRIRELTVKGSNGTNTTEDKVDIQNEISQLVDGIKEISNNTEFNGVKMLGSKDVTDNASPNIVGMPSGANVGESIEIPQYNLNDMSVKIKNTGASSTSQPYFYLPISSVDLSQGDVDLGGGKILKGVDLNKAKIPNPAAASDPNADKYINVSPSMISDLKTSIASSMISGETEFSPLSIIDNSISDVMSIRSKYGALENRFQDSYDGLGEIGDKMEGADSNIRDADVAEEMMEYSKSNILVEAGNAMMVQTNKFPQDVLRILQGVK